MNMRVLSVSFLVSVLVCSVAASIAAESPAPAKPAANAETDSKDKQPLIVHNADGTMTVQKAPVSRKPDAEQKGLVIPPQVVVPTARAPANQKAN